MAEIKAMTNEHLRRVEVTWTAAFEQRYRHQQHDEDSWMWCPGGGQLDLLTERLRLQSFGLVAGETTVGVMFLNSQSHFSRLERQQPLVYINYVATAPWNRRNLDQVGQLRGVGTSLMDWANRYSREIGCEGRLGLHSLQSSNSFYTQLCFCNLGIDAARRGMSYFERCVAHDETYHLSRGDCLPG